MVDILRQIILGATILASVNLALALTAAVIYTIIA